MTREPIERGSERSTLPWVVPWVARILDLDNLSAICIVERWGKSMDYRFVSKCNHAQESHTIMSILFSAIFAGPLFVEIPTFCYHGKVT